MTPPTNSQRSVGDIARDLAQKFYNNGWTTAPGDLENEVLSLLKLERQRADSLTAVCEKMREALKPFAETYDQFSSVNMGLATRYKIAKEALEFAKTVREEGK